MPVLGLAGSHQKNKGGCPIDLASYVHDIHAKICRYRWMISSPFPHHTIASLPQVGMMGLTPLLEIWTWGNRCLAWEKDKKNNKVEVLHLFRCFTHTPRCRGMRSLKLDCSNRNQKIRDNGARRIGQDWQERWNWKILGLQTIIIVGVAIFITILGTCCRTGQLSKHDGQVAAQMR